MVKQFHTLPKISEERKPKKRLETVNTVKVEVGVGFKIHRKLKTNKKCYTTRGIIN